MKTKILLISVGSMVSQNVLETLTQRREHLYIIGTDASADAPLYDCDKIVLTPLSQLPPSDYAEALSTIIRNEKPDLVIPGRDIDVIILAMLKSKFPEIADKFITGEATLAQQMEDKWFSFLFARDQKLPFADTLCCHFGENKKEIQQFVRNHGYPLLVKPRKGFASKAVTFVLNDDQLYSMASDGDMIVQEYLGAPEKILAFHNTIMSNGLPLFYSLEEIKYSVQCFIGPRGELKGSVVTTHKMKNGVSAAVQIEKNPGLDTVVQKFYKVFASKGWRGPLNIQMQKSQKTGELKAYEFNGRYTGATAARYYLGYDEVGFALEQVPNAANGKCEHYASQQSAIKQTYISERPINKMAILDKYGTWEL